MVDGSVVVAQHREELRIGEPARYVPAQGVAGIAQPFALSLEFHIAVPVDREGRHGLDDGSVAGHPDHGLYAAAVKGEYGDAFDG